MKMAHDYLAHWLSTRVSVYVVSVCVCVHQWFGPV